MKSLIRKILKESEDEFEWARGLDMKAAEVEIQKPWRDYDYEYGSDLMEVYDFLVETGYTNIDHLKSLGSELAGKVRLAHDNGYESGTESCDCDGCCDEYVYYDDHHDAVSQAREEGKEEGITEGREESQDEIDELKGQISELQDTIEELRSRLSS